MARKPRIAASVFFGLATVALCMLWVAGYVAFEGSYLGFDWRAKYYSIMWGKGHLGMLSVLSKDHGHGNDTIFIGGRHQSMETVLGFRRLVFDNGWNFTVPIWFPVSIFAALSFAVWHR